jgi:hypothetical protein
LASVELGSFSFQPLNFHLESADLLVRLGFSRFLLLQLSSYVAAKDRRPFFQLLT